MPCLAPIGLCYKSIFCVQNWILRISNIIFIWVLLMFCQNPLFGPYRFVSQKSYDNIPSKFLSTIETFFYLCFRGISEVFQRPPKKSVDNQRGTSGARTKRFHFIKSLRLFCIGHRPMGTRGQALLGRTGKAEHTPKVTGWIWEKVKILNFWGLDPLGCIWMLYVCSGDMVCAVWTCYMSSGDRICCVDMLYVFWG